MTQRFAILRTAAQLLVSACTERRFRCAILAAVFASSVAAGTSWALPCTEIDTRCMVEGTGTCQTDGSCLGTNRPNGTTCNDGNDCTIDDTCQSGHCAGGSFASPETLCQSFYGQCLRSAAHCQLLGFCIPDDPPDIVDCPPGADLCNVNFCNPGTGECMSIHNDCNGPCATAQCDSATGDCINLQPINEGLPCDDFNECTDTHCQAGECTTSGAQTPGPTNTPVPTGAPSVTPTPVSSDCIGDCSGNRNVVIDELRTGLGLALGYEASCNAFGAPVTVDKLIRGVHAALEGCAQVPPSPTPTQTVIAPTPTITPTAGGPSIPRRAAGVIESTTSAFLTIPNILSALLGHLPGSGLSATGGGAIDIISIDFDCTTGGGHLTCSQSLGFPLGPPIYTVDFSNCVVGTLTFTGSLTGATQQGFCGTLPSQLALSTNNLSVTNTTAAGSTTATFTNVQNAAIALSCSGGSCSCTYDTVTMQLNGTLTVVSTAGATVTSTAVTFHAGSSILIHVQQYGEQCVPTAYDMTVNGGVTLVTDGNIFDGTFDTYKLHATQIGDATSVEVTGAVTSSCVGGQRLSFLTPEPLNIPGVDPCPSAGLVTVSYDTTTDDLRFTNGTVVINNGAGGTFNSCLSPGLLVCPGS